jgi:alpha-beta hydrolase superfamily lysophospholipase
MSIWTRRRVLNRAWTAASWVAWSLTARATTPTGQQHPYRLLDRDWFDSTRNRAVPVRMYLPSAIKPGQRVPLVVFSHGIGGSRLGYSYLGRYWAAQGFASLHLQHVGSDRALWTGGSPLGLVGRLHGAAQDSEAIARARDLRFALDQMLTGDLAHLIDSNSIVAAGHSYGANTTLLTAGAQVNRQGQLLNLLDSRLRAAILISAPPFYGETAVGPILTSVRLPTLHITATDDVIRIPGYYSAAQDRIAIFDAVGSRQKMLVVFAGGSHSIFTDRAGTGGLLLNSQVKTATCELTTAFMQHALGIQGHGLQAWPQRYQAILARFEDAASTSASFISNAGL